MRHNFDESINIFTSDSHISNVRLRSCENKLNNLSTIKFLSLEIAKMLISLFFDIKNILLKYARFVRQMFT